MNTVLKTLIEKVDDMQEQMSNISKEMETLRRSRKEVLEIKNTINRNEECL